MWIGMGPNSLGVTSTVKGSSVFVCQPLWLFFFFWQRDGFTPLHPNIYLHKEEITPSKQWSVKTWRWKRNQQLNIQVTCLSCNVNAPVLVQFIRWQLMSVINIDEWFPQTLQKSNVLGYFWFYVTSSVGWTLPSQLPITHSHTDRESAVR